MDFKIEVSVFFLSRHSQLHPFPEIHKPEIDALFFNQVIDLITGGLDSV